MSAYFDRNKDHYIDHMFRLSTQGAWEAWIQFCLRGVVEQAQDTATRCGRLLDLNTEYQRKLREIGGSLRLLAIVNRLFESPVALVSSVQHQHAVTYPTARSDLQKLENAQIIRRIETYPKVAYYCPEIFDITYLDD
jgi:Fic family protein